MNEKINIVKANGETVPFDENKLYNSLKRAGVDENTQKQGVEFVKTQLKKGMTTSQIYGILFNHIRTINKPQAERYSLKQAVMKLGPSGYPFEKFVARILAEQGFETKVSQNLQGECLVQEIDVVAIKDGVKSLIEAKFHNTTGTKTDSKALMYTWARFMDVKDKQGFSDVWLVTNTKITDSARQYANCKGIKVLSWDSPKGNSLSEMIDKYNLYPITTCVDLATNDKETLLNEGIVLCKDIALANINNLSKKSSLSEKKLIIAQREAREIIEK